MRKFIPALAVIAIGVGTANAQERPKVPALSDEISTKDSLGITVSQVGANQVKLEAWASNSEPLAGITIPLEISSAGGKLKFDSVSYAGMRTEYFQGKLDNVPTPDSNSILIGLIADLSGTKPPLAKGQGAVAAVYYSSAKGVKAADVSVKPVKLAPSNELEFITPDVRRIRPTWVFKGAGTTDKAKAKDK